MLGQNTNGNYSDVRFYGVLNVTGNYVSWSRGSASVWSVSNGIANSYSRGSYTLVTQDVRLYHDDNGDYSATLSGSLSTTYASGTASGNFSLPRINRKANVTSGTDFTDEENPTIKFNNPGGFRLNARLEFARTSIQRDNIANTGSYTFELTDSERNLLRTKCNNSKTMAVREVIATCISGSTESQWSWVDRTMTVVNAIPTFTYTNEEVNSKAIELLSSSSGETVIKDLSQLKFTFVPVTYKNSTIKSVKVKNGNVTYSSGDNQNVTVPIKDSIFDLIVEDSRGYVITQKINKNLINYSYINIINFEFKRESPVSSNICLNATINYANVTFNNMQNTLKIKWRLNDGTPNLYPSDTLYPSNDLYMDTGWTEIPSSAYQISNNKITITDFLIENILPYTNQGTFYLDVSDLISEDRKNQLVIKGIPVFDYGENDFQVNGQLFIADENRENRKEIFANGIYSTDEQIIGIWFGKPLYRKTYSLGSWGLYSTGFASGEISVKRMYGYAYNGTVTVSIPSLQGDWNARLDVIEDGSKIECTDGGLRPAYTEIYVTIEYTKTID